jgi:hypothetical protein
VFKAIAVATPVTCSSDVAKAVGSYIAFEYRNEAFRRFVGVENFGDLLLHFSARTADT